MSKFLCVILVSAFAVAASAESKNFSYQLPITRDGQTVIRRAYNFWSGEYPTPMLKVGKKAGKTTLKAYKSVRKLGKQVACTVKNGVYHEWGKTGNSVINYYTIQALNEYQATADVNVDEISSSLITPGVDTTYAFKKGDVLDVVYGSEDYCVADFGKDSLGFECPNIEENTSFTKISPEDNFSEEWLYVSCAEGYNAFLDASTLEQQKGVYDAELVQYGEVK